MDNRISLLLKNNILNDSIWNSTVDFVWENGKKLTHFDEFCPIRKKI